MRYRTYRCMRIFMNIFIGEHGERIEERCVRCASLICPPNHPGGVANIKLKEQWERQQANELKVMS